MTEATSLREGTREPSTGAGAGAEDGRDANPIVQVKELTVGWGYVVLLKEVTFDVRRGEILRHPREPAAAASSSRLRSATSWASSRLRRGRSSSPADATSTSKRGSRPSASCTRAARALRQLDGRRERRAAARGVDGAPSRRHHRHREGEAPARRARRGVREVSERALRRHEAACGHRPLARSRAGARVPRRTERRPRSDYGRRD